MQAAQKLVIKVHLKLLYTSTIKRLKTTVLKETWNRKDIDKFKRCPRCERKKCPEAFFRACKQLMPEIHDSAKDQV